MRHIWQPDSGRAYRIESRFVVEYSQQCQAAHLQPEKKMVQCKTVAMFRVPSDFKSLDSKMQTRVTVCLHFNVTVVIGFFSGGVSWLLKVF